MALYDMEITTKNNTDVSSIPASRTVTFFTHEFFILPYIKFILKPNYTIKAGGYPPAC